MAISHISTLLPPDEYARIMAIPGWLFNQMNHTERPKRGCDETFLQSGYTGNPNMITGRDEIAQAIATAERKAADYAGFFVAPRWVQREQHPWIGRQVQVPVMHTKRGYLIAAGTEAWELIASGVTVTYSDPDGDGVNEWATVTVNTTVDPCEIAVVPNGRDPNRREWRIRPLDIESSAGVATIQGWAWLFGDPDLWLTINDGELGNVADQLATVDIYRHYNKTFPTQAEYQWMPEVGSCATTATCTPLCQSACVVVMQERIGQFYARTATWSGGAWNSASWAGTGLPSSLFVWYYAGYRDPTAMLCETMGHQLKEAIVRLANCYLPEAPCGCDYTRQRWETDREEMPMTSYDVALAQSAFGTTMRGAVFARAVLATIPPLGQGG